MKKYAAFLIAILWMFTLGEFHAQALDAAEHITVLLIVDNSGSMKNSDPTGLRYTAVRLFASLLEMNDSLGLIIFSTDSTVQTNGIVTLDTWDEGTKLLKNLQTPAPNGYTDVKNALDSAKEILEGKKSSSGKVVIVLLTDGKPEIENPYLQYEKETLDLARALNIPIIAIALTSSAQTPFLDRLADTTNGEVIPADNASDLLNNYLQVLGRIKDRTVIGGGRFKSSSSLTIEQTLAPYVNSAKFVFAKPENVKIRLFAPDGNEVTKDHSSDPRFSLFTLERPAGGVYLFQAQGAGDVQAWAILRSRLRVQIVEPRILHPLDVELPVVINLFEETPAGKYIKIIGEANFSALVTGPDGEVVSLDRFYDDGTHGDATADDGDYTRILPGQNLEGSYLISVQGWKNAVPVQTETRVTVRKFPNLRVDAPLGKNEVRGTALELKVHLDGLESFEQGQVIARVLSPSGETDEIILTGKKYFTGRFLPSEDGEYHVTFETRGAKFQTVDYQVKVEHTFDVAVIPIVNVSVIRISPPAGCIPFSNEFPLALSTVSSGKETLYFSVPNGWDVVPKSLDIKKGQQEILLRVLASDELKEGVTRLELLIEGRDSLEVQPAGSIDVEIKFPGIYTRCQRQINFGIIVLLLVGIGGTSIQRARTAALPPLASGTLRHWEIGKNPTQADEIDLTTMGKHALLIGSGATCDVMIPHADLLSEHARVITEKIPDSKEMVLEPIGEVRKGYHKQTSRFTLRHGETFRMGSHEFQFLSDSG
ncbi:MAG: VWA domain-containing protein [Chloroflexi bacterium]|nr:VWA domain-containing protein [Chloroflexota bacterium]